MQGMGAKTIFKSEGLVAKETQAKSIKVFLSSYILHGWSYDSDTDTGCKVTTSPSFDNGCASSCK